jgi:hypothetical protein
VPLRLSVEGFNREAGCFLTIAKAIEPQGIDFAPTEDFFQSR